MILKRFVKGIDEEAFFQKRAPKNRPDWIAGRRAEVRLRHRRPRRSWSATRPRLAWVINLGCIDLNPHPVQAEDLDHPDELRIDLDPVPGVDWQQIVDVAFVAKDVLEDHGLIGWPKTSGSRGFHIYARIEPRWTYPARTPRRRVARPRGGEPRARPGHEHGGGRRSGRACSSTSTRTPRTARSPRPTRCDPRRTRECRPRCRGTRSADCRPEAFTIPTVLERYAAIGDPWRGHR